MSEIRPSTMEDVARAAGVSKMTVSYVLSGKRKISARTREAVMRAARDLQFEPNMSAQQLSSGQNPRAISLYSTYLSIGVDSLKVKRLEALLQECHYAVSFQSYGLFSEDPAVQSAAMHALRRQRPRAIVCDASGLPDSVLDELRLYIQQGGNVVYYNCPIALDCDSVVFDHAHCLTLAARRLLQSGHRKIGLHVLGNDAAEEPYFVQQVRRGFADALAEFGLSPRPEWFFRGASYDNHEEGGARTAHELLLLRERPTAMCFVNDTAAAAFVVELYRMGLRVPEDISVVGTDDLPIARYSLVPLTTVTHPVNSIAANTVDLVISRLEKGYDGPPRQIVIQGELVERSSVHAPPSE
jgi:LacI family transcriptional regulator